MWALIIVFFINGVHLEIHASENFDFFKHLKIILVHHHSWERSIGQQGRRHHHLKKFQTAWNGSGELNFFNSDSRIEKSNMVSSRWNSLIETSNIEWFWEAQNETVLYNHLKWNGSSELQIKQFYRKNLKVLGTSQ